MTKTEEFLEFLLPFFTKNDMKKLAQKHSKSAYEFVLQFYLHSSNHEALTTERNLDEYEYQSDNQESVGNDYGDQEIEPPNMSDLSKSLE